MKRGFPTSAAVVLLALVQVGCRSQALPVVEKPTPAEPPRLSWRFEYDDADRPIKILDPAGQATTFEYRVDDKGRLVEWKRKRADGTEVAYQLDGRGRRVAMTDPGGKVRYEYDGFGRLTAVHREGQPAVQYGYDTLDRLESMRVGDAFEVRYAYDFLGRLARMETPAGPVSYEYRKGTSLRTLPGGVGTAWEYGPGDRLDKIVHFDRDQRQLAEYAYTYRPDGPLAAVTETGPDGERTVRYEYDTMRRLVKATDSRRGTVAYGYDQFGNRIQTTVDDAPPVVAEYDWAGRLDRYAAGECGHDGAGNVTSITEEHGQRTFGFDAANLLVSVGAGDDRITYGYDGDGRLISRHVGDQSTTYVPDYRAAAWQPLAAVDSQGNAVHYAWEGETPLAASAGERVRFFLTDRLGSVRLSVGADGVVAERFDYAPFGASSQPVDSRHLEPRFAGLFFDAAAGLYLSKGRGYDPGLGRFLQEDWRRLLPGATPQELSLYAYCGNDPVNFVDGGGARPGIPAAGAGASGMYPSLPAGTQGDSSLPFRGLP